MKKTESCWIEDEKPEIVEEKQVNKKTKSETFDILKKMTVPQLKEICRSKNLKVGGTKGELLTKVKWSWFRCKRTKNKKKIRDNKKKNNQQPL